MLLIDIPPGVLLMGDDRLSEASPRHRLQIGPFQIGKFPVTNDEFSAFVRDGGYSNQEYWTAMGWKALQARPQAAPAFWNDPRFNAPGQPVVGITWYEAAAFSRWLSRREHGSFRLPSEAEWEYAARGPESDRNFPWGERFDPGRANTLEMGLGRTTPVDRFPAGASPFGVWDMSGNVFEWTLSRWGRNWQECEFGYPYRGDDGREELEGSGARVMRGGSWFNRSVEALCAFRSRYLAGSRGSNIGFRLVQVNLP